MDAGGVAAAADELLSLERSRRCGISHASSAARIARSTTTRIFWRRCLAAIRALFADRRRLTAAAEEAIYGSVVVESGGGVEPGADTNAVSASDAMITPLLSPVESEMLSMP